MRPVAPRLSLTAALLTLIACGGGGGSGTAGGTPATRSVGGAVVGLVGTGRALLLADGAGHTVVVGQDGTFTFPVRLAEGSAYAVTVVNQPTGPAQTCAVAGGTGVVGAADVQSVGVTCAPPAARTVSVSVGNLVGSGLRLSLTGAGALTVAPPGGTVSWATPLAYGASYQVSIDAMPAAPAQVCRFADASYAGVIGEADVTVTVACDPPAYTLGGTVAGLVGTGLVLLSNGVELPISADGAFTFPRALPDGTAYDVVVRFQPTRPAQRCTVAGGSGDVKGANVTGVAVTCTTSTFTVGGTATGLVGTGLTLGLNGGSALPIGGNGAFAFPALADGSRYDVTLRALPGNPLQTCAVSNGSGTLAGADVTSVLVTCTSKIEASAVALGSTQVEIRWAPFGVVPTGYEVYYASKAGDQLIATLPAGASSFVHRGLAPAATYYYRVAALLAGPPLSSALVSARTLPQTTFFTAPTGLNAVVTATRWEGDAVTLHWDLHAEATSYAVYRTSYPELIGTAQGRILVGTTDAATTTLTDPTGPAAGVHHYQLYAIRASPAATSPVATLPVTVNQGGLLSQERPWLDLFRSAYDRTVLHLHWYGAPGTTTQHVYASSDSSRITPAEGSLAPPLDLGTTNVPIVETSPGKYLMDVPYGLFTPGTMMWFRVASVGAQVESYSEEAVGVSIRAPAPAGVGSLAASARNPTTIRLTWGMAAGASTYNVYRLPDPATPIAPQHWVGATGALDYTDTGLRHDTTYVYRVTAVATGGAESAPSDYAAVRTLVEGAPIMIIPAVQPGPIPFSAILGWIPRNGGTTFRVHGGDALAVPDVDMTKVLATTSALVETVYVSTPTLLLSLATMSMAPPVGAYAVAEVYPDGTASALSNMVPVIYFF